MKSSKNALIISDNIQLTEELKRLLAELDISDVRVAISNEKAVSALFADVPTFTFLDLDSETIKTQPLAKIIQNSEVTKLSLISTKNHDHNCFYAKSENVCFIRKPVTLTKINDIVNPHLSFANLLEEAKALLRQETGSQEWQV